MKTLLNLSIALMITFSTFAAVVYFAPTKTIAEKEYKIIFGSPVKTISLF